MDRPMMMRATGAAETSTFKVRSTSAGWEQPLVTYPAKLSGGGSRDRDLDRRTKVNAFKLGQSCAVLTQRSLVTRDAALQLHRIQICSYIEFLSLSCGIFCTVRFGLA